MLDRVLREQLRREYALLGHADTESTERYVRVQAAAKRSLVEQRWGSLRGS